MGSYSVTLRKSAERELRKVPEPDLVRVVERIHSLSRHPRPPGCQRLSGAQAWRIRQGDWRVVYEIDDPAREVTIVKIGNRREVYR